MSLGLLLFSTALGLSMAMCFAWLLQRRPGSRLDRRYMVLCDRRRRNIPRAGAAEGRIARRQAIYGCGAFACGFRQARSSYRLPKHERWRGPALSRSCVEWGEDFPRRLFWFLQIQAACAFLLSLAVFLAARNPAAFPAITDIFGAAIVIVAILGEAWSDASLARFRMAHGAGRSVCTAGAWAWSRHPNYFFQWLGWVGFAVIAVDPRASGRRAGSHRSRPLLSIGFSYTSPACRRWKSTCSRRVAKPFAPTSLASTSFFRVHDGAYEFHHRRMTGCP